MSRKSILAFFNHAAEPDLRRIREGIVPAERLYGVVELIDRGWSVVPCDDRFVGRFAQLAERLRHYGFNPVNLRTLKRVADHEILLVKDEFSLLLTLAARLLGKRIIYLDSLFAIPKNKLKRWLLGLNLRLASVVLCYSRFQAQLWSEEFGVPATKFQVVPYTIDLPFYRGASATDVHRNDTEPPYILSVGRDMGRDFETLLQAVRGTGLRVKLITLPYLMPPSAPDSPDVDILERISYPELFRLYAGAKMAVVPLKRDVTYPSGIRAVLESLAVGCATIATRTAILQEYVPDDGRNVVYVDAENVADLRAAICRLTRDSELRHRLQQSGRDHVAAHFQMPVFVDQLERMLV